MNGIELQDREFFAAIRKAASRTPAWRRCCRATRCWTSWSGSWSPETCRHAALARSPSSAVSLGCMNLSHVCGARRRRYCVAEALPYRALDLGVTMPDNYRGAVRLWRQRDAGRALKAGQRHRFAGAASKNGGVTSRRQARHRRSAPPAPQVRARTAAPAVETIDLYWLGQDAPIEESVGAMADLARRQGASAGPVGGAGATLRRPTRCIRSSPCSPNTRYGAATSRSACCRPAGEIGASLVAFSPDRARSPDRHAARRGPRWMPGHPPRHAALPAEHYARNLKLLDGYAQIARDAGWHTQLAIAWCRRARERGGAARHHEHRASARGPGAAKRR